MLFTRGGHWVCRLTVRAAKNWLLKQHPYSAAKNRSNSYPYSAFCSNFQPFCDKSSLFFLNLLKFPPLQCIYQKSTLTVHLCFLEKHILSRRTYPSVNLPGCPPRSVYYLELTMCRSGKQLKQRRFGHHQTYFVLFEVSCTYMAPSYCQSFSSTGAKLVSKQTLLRKLVNRS